MAGEKIDEAFVEIKPDVDHFARDVERELTSAFRDVDRKLDDVVDSIDDGFDRLIQSLEISFDNLAFDIKESLGDIADGAGRTSRSIATSMSAGANAAERSVDDLADEATQDLRRIERQARDTGRTLARSMGGGAAVAAGAGAISQLSEVGGVLRNLIAIPTSLASSLVGVAFVALIAAAVPAVIALVGALIDLSAIVLALPAALGFLIAAIAPLIIAFQGVGTAISALIEGDLEKLDEALKKLTPSAQAFVREFGTILKPLRDIKASVQEAFFAPLRGVLSEIGRAVLPVLNTGLTSVAQVLGSVAAQFGRLLTTPGVLEAIKTILSGTAGVLKVLGPAIVKAFGVLIQLMAFGMPLIERFAGWFSRLVDRFAEFQTRSINSGDWMQWIEDGIAVLKDLGALLGAVVNLISALAGDAGDEGRSFIQTLTDMTNRLAEFFRSAEGQEFLADMFRGLKFAQATLMFLVDAFKFAANAANAFFDGLDRVVGALMSMWHWLGNVGASARANLVALGQSIVGAWNAVVAFFTTTVPAAAASALTFVTGLPERLSRIVTAAFDRLFFLIGFGIGTMIANFISLPSRIGALFTQLWDTVTNRTQTGVSRVGTFINNLPGIIADAISRAWSTGVALFRQGMDNVVNTANTLPGRIFNALRNVGTSVRNALSSAISTASSVGRSIIDGVIDGVQSAAGRLVDAAKRAVLSALAGAKRALGANSPSKAFAELGSDSVAGYVQGFDRSMNVSESDIANAIRSPLESSSSVTNNHTEAATGPIIVNFYLDGELVDQRVITALQTHPQEVALAGEAGTTRLARRR